MADKFITLGNLSEYSSKTDEKIREFVAGYVKKSDIVTLTQSEYDSLSEKTADFYFVKEDGVSS